MNKYSDFLWATLGEGVLVLAVAAIAWATQQPLGRPFFYILASTEIPGATLTQSFA